MSLSDAPLEFGAEMADQALNRPGGRIAERTGKQMLEAAE